MANRKLKEEVEHRGRQEEIKCLMEGWNTEKNWKTGGEFLLVKRILFKGHCGERVVSVPVFLCGISMFFFVCFGFF